MATVIGRLHTVAVSTDDSTYYAIGKILNSSVNMSTDMAEETNCDSLGWKEYKYANSGVTISVTAKYNAADSGQALLLTEWYTSRAGLYVRFRPQTSAGEMSYKGLFLIDSLSVSSAHGDVQEITVGFTNTGAITKSVQT